MSKKFEDVFEIKAGRDWRSNAMFICESKRLGTKIPEPYDTHRIEQWICEQLKLVPLTKGNTAKIKVTVMRLNK
jgi:hypothetical protein